MKWWVAGTAGAALILAGVSIWLGSSVGELVTEAQNLWFASLILAVVAALLEKFNADGHQREIWARTLLWFILLSNGMVLADELKDVPKGSFCSRYLAEGGATCVQSAPLVIDIFLFAPIFILAIAALLSTFWPSKQNPVMAARQTASPPR